jgi:hypothetical protein
MSNEEWELFRVFPDLSAAEALRLQLEHHSVPTLVESKALEVGLEAQFCVYVSKALAHRARWVVAQLPLTDAELEFMATGKLPGEEK